MGAPFKYKLNTKGHSFYSTPTSFSQASFIEGVNYSVLSTAIDFEKQIADCENMVVALDQFCRTRQGFVKQVFEAYTSSGIAITLTSPIQGIGSYDGEIVIACGGNIYINGLPSIGTCHATNPVNFLKFKDYLFILDGEYLKRYNGSTYSIVPGSPKAKIGLVHKDRLWVVGGNDGYLRGNAGESLDAHNGDETYAVHPYTVYVSGPRDEEDWGYISSNSLGTFFEFDAYVEDNVNYPNEITGIALYSNSVIIFKTGQYQRIYRIDGSTLSDFSATPAYEGNTSINQQTVASTASGVFYMHNDGVYVSGGESSVSLVTKNINNRFLPEFNNPTEGIYLSTLRAEFDSVNGLYLIGYNTRLYAFNIYTNGWFRWSLPSSMTSIKKLEDGLYIGTSKGSILKYMKSDATGASTYYDWSDNLGENVPITSVLTTGAYPFTDSTVVKHIKHCYLMFEAAEQGEVDIKFLSNMAPVFGVGVQTEYDVVDSVVHSPTSYSGISTLSKRIVIGVSESQGWDEGTFATGTLTHYTHTYINSVATREAGTGAGTIDRGTNAISVTFDVPPTASSEINANYWWNDAGTPTLVTGEIIGTQDGTSSLVTFSGTLAHTPIAGTLVVTPKWFTNYAETFMEVPSDSVLGWDTPLISIGFDGSVNTSTLHKLPVGARCMTLGVQITATDTPINLQYIAFNGALLRQAP